MCHVITSYSAFLVLIDSYTFALYMFARHPEAQQKFNAGAVVVGQILIRASLYVYE